jgi:hypothetical protein
MCERIYNIETILPDAALCVWFYFNIENGQMAMAGLRGANVSICPVASPSPFCLRW